MIKGLVEEVAATGHSSIHGALDEVFQIMANDTSDFPNTKIECNPTILMLSDGEGPYPQEVLERMNPDQRVSLRAMKQSFSPCFYPSAKRGVL